MVAALFSLSEPKGRIRPMDILLAVAFIFAGSFPLLAIMLDMKLNPELYLLQFPNMSYLMILVIFQGVF